MRQSGRFSGECRPSQNEEKSKEETSASPFPLPDGGFPLTAAFQHCGRIASFVVGDKFILWRACDRQTVGLWGYSEPDDTPLSLLLTLPARERDHGAVSGVFQLRAGGR